MVDLDHRSAHGKGSAVEDGKQSDRGNRVGRVVEEDEEGGGGVEEHGPVDGAVEGEGARAEQRGGTEADDGDGQGGVGLEDEELSVGREGDGLREVGRSEVAGQRADERGRHRRVRVVIHEHVRVLVPVHQVTAVWRLTALAVIDIRKNIAWYVKCHECRCIQCSLRYIFYVI